MEKQRIDEKLAELEALLFIHGEPLAISKIGKILELGEGEWDELRVAFEESIAGTSRGFALLSMEGKVQLATKPQFAKVLDSFMKEQLSEDLTPAALETLAIIAYFGPISRSRIEYQRGVNSIFILRNLLLRGLVERFPNPDRPNTYLYQASFEMLKHLGISKKEDLPDYGKYQELLKNFENNSEFEQPPHEQQQ